MPDPTEGPTDPGATPAPAPSGVDIEVRAHIEGRLLELVGDNQRRQFEQQSRLLWLIVVGGVLNTAIVSLITGASLAIDMGAFNLQTNSAAGVSAHALPGDEPPALPGAGATGEVDPVAEGVEVAGGTDETGGPEPSADHVVPLEGEPSGIPALGLELGDEPPAAATPPDNH